MDCRKNILTLKGTNSSFPVMNDFPKLPPEFFVALSENISLQIFHMTAIAIVRLIRYKIP